MACCQVEEGLAVSVHKQPMACYQVEECLPETLALELIQLTLIVVMLSILFHGISVKPLRTISWRRSQRQSCWIQRMMPVAHSRLRHLGDQRLRIAQQQ